MPRGRLAFFLTGYLTGFKRLHGSQQRANQMTLFLGQVRMPDIKDQDNACARTLIARFMLYRIVKHPSLAALPQPDLIAAPEPAAIWHN